MFFSFDGIDGVGKSTQVQRLAAWLRDQGREVVLCRDPGSTSLGESIRRILLEDHDTPIQLRSEMLLYMAARAQLVGEIIRPALAASRTVISDRFLLSNVAYQGYYGELDAADVWQVGQVATTGLEPDLTLLLDMPAEAAAARIRRAHDRMEQRGVEYLARVRDGFLAEAARRPERIAVIDAARSPDEVHRDVLAAAKAALARTG